MEKSVAEFLFASLCDQFLDTTLPLTTKIALLTEMKSLVPFLD